MWSLLCVVDGGAGAGVAAGYVTAGAGRVPTWCGGVFGVGRDGLLHDVKLVGAGTTAGVTCVGPDLADLIE